MIRSVGLFVGPFLGGSLADPASRWPNAFGNAFWQKYPYLLPNLVVGSVEIFQFIAMLLFFKETAPALKHRRDPGLRLGSYISRRLGFQSVIDGEGKGDDDDDDETTTRLLGGSNDGTETLEGSSSDEESATAISYGSCAAMDARTCPETPKKPGRTYTPQVRYMILVTIIIAFHKSSSDVMNPSLLALPIRPSPHDGNPLHFSSGFGLNTNQVGNALVAQAVVGSACQLVIPRIVKGMGALRALRISLCIYPFVYLVTPFLVLLPGWLGRGLMLVSLWGSISIVSVAYACHGIM